MANPAYTVDFTEATKPALGAMKDVGEIQHMQARAAYEGAATQNLQQQTQMGEIALNKAKYQQTQDIEKQKRDNTVVPLDSLFKKYGIIDDNEKQLVTRELAEGGFTVNQPDGKLGTKIGWQKDIQERLDSNLAGHITFGKLRIQNLDNRIKTAEQEIQDPKTQKDPKAVDKLKGQIAQWEKAKVTVNNDLMAKDLKMQQNIAGVEAAVKGLGKDDAEVKAYLAKHPELSAAIQGALKTGDPTAFHKLLEEIGKPMKPEKSLADIAAEADVKERTKAKYRKPDKPSKITGNVAINPETQKEEYLMTDGSFSGKQPGAKPSNKQEIVPGGGKAKTKTYKTPEEVRDDKSLTQEQKIKILQTQFKMS